MCAVKEKRPRALKPWEKGTLISTPHLNDPQPGDRGVIQLRLIHGKFPYIPSAVKLTNQVRCDRQC